MSASNTQPSDAEILAAVLSGDRKPFAILVQRYRGPLLAVACNRLGRDDWAEEVVQEAFLCAWKSLPSYDSRYSFRTWLWTILLNQCRRHAKRSARRPRVWSWSDRGPVEKDNADDAMSLLSGEPSPPAALLAKERSERLARFLDRLPLQQADALRLRFYGGLKFQEIADTMGCSISSAKNRVRWGLMKLSRMMVTGEVK